jgi:hypothetical protein
MVRRPRPRGSAGGDQVRLGGTVTDVEMEFLVPAGVFPLDYRDQARARACELGWPPPHSGGTSFEHESHLVVDLAWKLDSNTDPAPVISALEAEFYVRRVHVGP